MHRFLVHFISFFVHVSIFYHVIFPLIFGTVSERVLDGFCIPCGACLAPPGWTRELTFGCQERPRASSGGLLVVLGAVLGHFGDFGALWDEFNGF